MRIRFPSGAYAGLDFEGGKLARWQALRQPLGKPRCASKFCRTFAALAATDFSQAAS
jgi:hypothetical protein